MSTIIPRFNFHSQGNCWRFFGLPRRHLYYSGHMIVWQWWRIALTWENFKKRAGCQCPSCSGIGQLPPPNSCENCREQPGHDCIHEMSSDRCIVEKFLCDDCARRMDYERSPV